MLAKVSGKDTTAVVAALSQHVQQLPATLRRSPTWDRGLEMAQHKSFTMATDVQVYFCDPQSPWQRGSNENTNGLLRQYLPKKTDLSCYSQEDLDEIALRLNQRPRKTSGFQTPADKLQASVASTPSDHREYRTLAIRRTTRYQSRRLRNRESNLEISGDKGIGYGVRCIRRDG